MGRMLKIVLPHTRARDSYIYAAMLLLIVTLAIAPILAFGAPAQPAVRPDVGQELRGSDKNKRRQAAEKLLSRAAQASPADIVRASSAETDADIQVKLHQLLGNDASEASVAALVNSLKTGSPAIVRVSAAQQLGRIRGGDAALKALLKGLTGDADKDVRAACAVGLGSYRTPEAAKALAKAASDKAPGVRRRIAFALSKHPKSADRDSALTGLEKDSDAEVAGKARAFNARLKASERAVGKGAKQAK